MAAFQDSTHVSEPERTAFAAMGEARFTDVVRPFTPGPGVHVLGLHPASLPAQGGHVDRFHLALTGIGRQRGSRRDRP